MNKKVLIVDVGNTAIEFAVFDNENFKDFLGFFHFPNDLEKAKNALEKYKNDYSNIDEGMIFSVVPNNNDLIKKLVSEVFGKDIKVFDWKNYKLKNKNDLIKEAIGADLLADIKGAEKEYGGPALIADFGTVTKLLLLDNDSSFDGLSFIPGIEISLKLFNTNTALLPETKDLKVVSNRLGLNTVESMQHGVYYSTIYYVKEVYKSLNYKNCKLILTGGNLRYVKDEFKDAIIDPKLTLKGMYILYKEIEK